MAEEREGGVDIHVMLYISYGPADRAVPKQLIRWTSRSLDRHADLLIQMTTRYGDK